jgi:LacI family transcriptional regulator
VKPSPVTLKQLAQALGLSVSTVSRALRGRPEIAPATQQAVRQLAQQLDYQPNQLAQSLVHSATKTLGVVVPDLGYHFYAAVLYSIEQAAAQAGYSVLVAQSHESQALEAAGVQNLLRAQVEGLLVALARDTTDYAHLHRLIERQVPLVFFDRHADGLPATAVVVDNQAAACQATQHLLASGRRRIAFLAGPPTLHLSNQRLAGYHQALAQAGLPPPPGYVRHVDYTAQTASREALALWQLPHPPDALLTVSDRVAYPAMHALRRAGARIPEQVALVSFNNEPACEYMTPSLSSVAQPLAQIGQAAVALLLAQIKAPKPTLPQRVVLATELVVRASSGGEMG